ncbi:MAG: hypothetical protein H7Y60_16805 [Rhodospirillaceae bacterium]|nr:hypothetical protein [Rhodospirillales bacterium]
MKASFIVGLAALAASALPVMAQESGSIGCAQDFGMVKQYLMDNRAKLSATQLQSAQQRLEVAAGQCMSSTSVAQTDLAQLRRELGMQAMDSQPMSAAMPSASR